MLYEFALEPAVLSTWENFRYFIDKFGVEHGRLISQFPKRWKKQVYEALSACRGTPQMARIEVLLNRLRPTLLKTSRPYDKSLDWMKNAETQQDDGSPFRAIVAHANPRAHAAVLVSGDLTDESELWAVPRQKQIPRQPEALAAAAAPLIRWSREILFIDPHFDPWSDRWQKAFVALCAVIDHSARPPLRVEFHISASKWINIVEKFNNECDRQLPRLLSTGREVEFFLWRQKIGGERMHARFVLTDRGGMQFEGGLDPGKRGETTDISFLTQEIYKQRWSDYQTETTTFELFGKHTIQGV